MCNKRFDMLHIIREENSMNLVRIGKIAINMDLVTDIAIYDDRVEVFFSFNDNNGDQASMTLKGKDKNLMVAWLDRNAERPDTYPVTE